MFVQEPDPEPLCPGGLGYRAWLYWSGRAQGLGVVCGDACYDVTLVSGTAEVWGNNGGADFYIGDFFDDAAGAIGYGPICCDQFFSAWVQFNGVLDFPIHTMRGTYHKECAVVGNYLYSDVSESGLAPCPS